ncbi:hypothetical protein CFN78_23600 [Amycolatopsis antarctica]|uniref:Uncharacterized protein n=1 Tax=Amycolatopsis antarctica TaxID=1854586 RepID=A0A263CX13_9PSEU|nr:DUF6153 family protein [Amycolatopsis antarctica]OZM70672.1 hypothetical protein CFN78_23600 [Amycolatopsis antarctica]
MSGKARGGFARWLLLCAVALGVVAMHHVGAEPGHPPTGHHSAAVSVAEHPSMLPLADEPMPHGGGHDLGHLCLAILGAAAGVALALLLVYAHRGQARELRRGIGAWAAARGPPPTPGRHILLTSCVLRQ